MNREHVLRPELLLKELLTNAFKDGFVKRTEYIPIIQRAVVIAVDMEGGKLENPSGDGKFDCIVNGEGKELEAKLGPANPQNSIKARVLTNGEDKFSDDQNLRVFWPFFPEHISYPIKPGEHVYVMYEDSQKQHGLWIGKVPGHEGVNFAKGEDFYKSEDTGRLTGMFSDSSEAASSNEQEKFDSDEAASESKSENRLSSKF